MKEESGGIVKKRHREPFFGGIIECGISGISLISTTLAGVSSVTHILLEA